MNHQIFILLLLIIGSFDSYGQEFDCSKYYNEYCKKLQTDSLILPNYTAGYFISGSDTNPSNISIPDCINDLEAFCSGVKQALEADKLSIRQVGDPGHVSACSYTSYEIFGVHLVMTGDIITDVAVFDENNGFNFIMKQRILDSLGIDTFRKIGIKDSSWIEFDDKQMRILFETMTIESKTDSTMFMKIKKTELAKTEFKNLKGVIFTDALNQTDYSYKDVLEGIELCCRGDKNKRAILSLNFNEYLNPSFCKSRYGSTWTIPIRLNE